MPIIEWDTSFELGIKEFDADHWHLVELLNQAYDNFTEMAERRHLEIIVDALIDYAKHHFAAEERWMRVHEYPELSSHILEHEQFTKTMLEIQEDLHGGKAELSFAILEFLKSWFIDHILRTDSDYGIFNIKNRHVFGDI